MRPRGLLFLSLLALAIGGYIWFVERDLPTTDELEAREDLLLDLEADDVQGIALTHAGEESSLQREADPEVGAAPSPFSNPSPWQLIEPMSARADGKAVDELLRQVAGLESVRSLEGADPAEYGLDPAVLRVSMTTGEGMTTLEVGSELPASTRRVVRVDNSDQLFVAEVPFFSKATQAAGDWRDRRLFVGGQNDIRGIRLRGSSGDVLLSRRGDRFWIESPISDLAARNEVDALLTTLSDLEATSFVDAPTLTPAEMGLEPALGEIEVLLGGKEAPFRVSWGAPVPMADAEDPTDSSGGTYYAQVEGVLVETDASISGPLARTVEEWRSMAWMTLPTYEVERFTVGGVQPMELARDGVDWKRDGERIPYTTVNQLLNRLSELRAVGLREAAVPKSGADLTFEMTAKDGTQTTLTMHRATDPGGENAGLATTSQRGAVLKFAAAEVDELHSLVGAIRAAEALSDDPTGDVAVTLDNGSAAP